MRIVICDDHRLFMDSLAVILRSRGYEIVTCATDPAHAVAAVTFDEVDVCLMDLAFPNGSCGFDNIATVRTASPRTAVVVLTGHSDPTTADRVKQLGAAAIVFKDEDIERIIDVMEQVHAGDSVTSKDRSVLPTPVPDRSSDVDLVRFLTTRERETLERLVHGENAGQLAQSMGITYSTARTHIQNVLTKLGVHSRLAAVAFAVSNSLVPIEAIPTEGDQRRRGTTYRESDAPPRQERPAEEARR